MAEVFFRDRDRHVGLLTHLPSNTEFRYESDWIANGFDIEPGMP